MNKINEFLNSAKYFTRNPLGIIALFISLIYAIAALVLTFSNSRLSVNQNWTLVLFIVLFPVLILITFVYLVVNHHEKLYGPSDYKDENNFFRYQNQEEQQKRIDESVQMLENEEKEPNPEETNFGIKNSGEKETNVESINNNKNINHELASFVFLIEEKVMRLLESEFNVNISRQVALGSQFQCDGVALKPNETIIIEVKYTIKNRIHPNIIRQIVNNISQIPTNINNDRRFRYLLVFVSDRPIVNLINARSKIVNSINVCINVEIRNYSLEQLGMKKLNTRG